MRTGRLLLLSTLTLASCGPLVEEQATPGERTDALITDVDLDGIDDAFEDQLAAKFAPEVRLAPDSIDWARPANVDWYLARVHMRFDHSGCPDCEVLALATPTQSNLSTQSHKTKGTFCTHTSTVYASNASRKEFFLQPPDDNVHKGTTSSGWRVYVHTKKSVVVSGGYDIQYWFFYPYNDSYASVNHEADWEHITVSTDAVGNFQSAWYAAHSGGHRYTASQLKWNGTHPIVYSADGSHASYPTAGTYPTEVSGFDDHSYEGGPVWQTWNNWVNVGEKNAPRNGQNFIKYGGRWGEVGELDATSGPQGPSFQGAWNNY
ncbi:Vps62-related protein [Archangium violaceum]|uniref:Vps62-related protein n=1 Tax=Archangium violaceum TaxID=83451 RepID=UPI0036DA8FD5